MGIDKFYRKPSFPAYSIQASEMDTGSITPAKIYSTASDGLNVARIAAATYDVVVDGGAPGSHSTGVTIPDNAIITKAWVDCITAGVRGSSGTIAFHVQAANDILTATASHLTTGIKAGAQTGAAAAFTKLTAARTIHATVATATMSAGKFIVYAEYVVSI